MPPKTLHLHSSGAPVRALQTLLRRYEPGLAVDGRFGPKTERAVRTAQRRLNIFPADGLAGAHTLAVLARVAATAPSRPSPSGPTGRSAAARGAGLALMQAGHEALMAVEGAAQAVERWVAGLSTAAAAVPPVLHPVLPPARAKAQHDPAPPGDVADPKNMIMSEKGRQFVFRHEAGNGHLTAHLHHPAGHSGVTIGPGYDMKARKAEDIAADLQAVGVKPADAAAAAKGAGLHDEAADTFVRDNKSLLNLSMGQQVQLQLVYKGRYEQMVRTAVHIPLHQYEFDALVSFAGNPGTRTYWHTATRLVNEHKPHEAAAEFFRAIHTGNPKLVQGLINRRTAESKLFLYGDYAA